MKYLIGKKEDFIDFLDSIGNRDRVAIISHNDLDGIGSSILIREILKARGLEGNVKSTRFVDYKKDLFSVLYPDLKKEKLSKLFVSDLNPENVDSPGFERLREKFDVFSIDHHPVGHLKDLGNIIKTETPYCTAFISYELGKGIIDSEKWKWLVCAALIADVGYKSPELLRFIQENYPGVTEKNIHESEIGKISSIITSSLIYFSDNPERVYELIRGKKLEQLKKYDEEVRKEISKWKGRFLEEAEYFPARDLYFYYYNPKFNITSIVSNLLSSTKPDSTFISVSDIKDSDLMKVSARNHNSRENMIHLLKKGIEGLENAIGGGHVPASGGSFMKKDLAKFKENILKR